MTPSKISSKKGRKTTYLKVTRVWEAPSPGNMYESPREVMSNKAMHRPTFSTTCQGRDGGRLWCWLLLFSQTISFYLISMWILLSLLLLSSSSLMACHPLVNPTQEMTKQKCHCDIPSELYLYYISPTPTIYTVDIAPLSSPVICTLLPLELCCTLCQVCSTNWSIRNYYIHSCFLFLCWVR